MESIACTVLAGHPLQQPLLVVPRVTTIDRFHCINKTTLIDSSIQLMSWLLEIYGTSL